MHYTYIIYSVSSDIYYKGYSLNPQNRLFEHNSGQSRYTEGKGPWDLVYTKSFPTKADALKEEKRLKKLNRKSIEMLIVE